MGVQIKPSLTHIWRSDTCIQLGVNPRIGTIIEGLTAGDRSLLRRLSRGVELSEPSYRSHELVQLLAEQGLLTRTRALRPRAHGTDRRQWRSRLTPDAAAWSLVHGTTEHDGWDVLSARQHRRVDIHGGGRLAMTLANLLASAGVGQVRLHDEGVVTLADVAPGAADAQDVGASRQKTTQARMQCYSDATRAANPRSPDIVVVIENVVADARAAQKYSGQSLALLSVVIQEGSIVVGPLVATSDTCCLGCLDLHRRARDPLWPQVLSQLLEQRQHPAEQPPQETASSALAASVSALQVLGYLDARVVLTPKPGESIPATPLRPAAIGATLEVELPHGLISRRPWPPHPACRCQTFS